MKAVMWVSLSLIGCTIRQPDPPRSCFTLNDCERVYAEELAAYTVCKDERYGAKCEDEEFRMNAAYQQRDAVEAREQTAKSAEDERVRQIAMDADRKAQAEEQKQAQDARQAVIDASRAEDERRAKEQAKVAEVERKAVAERQSAVVDRASALGFDEVVLRETGGLASYLRAVIAEGADVKTLSKTVIELSPEDAALFVRSVENGEGIFANGNGVVVIFRAPKGKTIYRGTTLPALVEAVRITSTRTLKSSGVSGQAFVVVPVW